jgi:hypothetical protein
MRPFALALLILPTLAVAATTAPTSSPSSSAPASSARVDYSLYQALLNERLSVTSAPGQPFETRFNYEGWHDEKGRADRAAKIRKAFLAVSPRKMDRNTRLAWGINFYNYLVLEQATQYLMIPDKFRQRYLSVKDIKIESTSFFEYPLVTVDSVSYTLSNFERHFLFADFDHQIGTQPPAELDPRIHFVANGGAVGYPSLQPRAFKPESLDAQLDSAVRQAMASPQNFVLRENPYTFQISALFGWYLADFGGAMKVIPWIQKYVSKPVSDKLQPYAERGLYGQCPWDWKLNQTLGWRFDEQMKAEPGTKSGAAAPGAKPAPAAPSKGTMRDSS